MKRVEQALIHCELPFETPKSGKIAVKAINHNGDEVLKVYRVGGIPPKSKTCGGMSDVTLVVPMFEPIKNDSPFSLVLQSIARSSIPH